MVSQSFAFSFFCGLRRLFQAIRLGNSISMVLLRLTRIKYGLMRTPPHTHHKQIPSPNPPPRAADSLGLRPDAHPSITLWICGLRPPPRAHRHNNMFRKARGCTLPWLTLFGCHL